MLATHRAVLVLIGLALASAGCNVAFTMLSPNLKLRIVSVDAVPNPVRPDGSSTLTATAENPNGGKLSYTWAAHDGSVSGTGATVRYDGSACCLGSDAVAVIVKNETGEADTCTISVTVPVQPRSEEHTSEL